MSSSSGYRVHGSRKNNIAPYCSPAKSATVVIVTRSGFEFSISWVVRKKSTADDIKKWIFQHFGVPTGRMTLRYSTNQIVPFFRDRELLMAEEKADFEGSDTLSSIGLLGEDTYRLDLYVSEEGYDREKIFLWVSVDDKDPNGTRWLYHDFRLGGQYCRWSEDLCKTSTIGEIKDIIRSSGGLNLIGPWRLYAKFHLHETLLNTMIYTKEVELVNDQANLVDYLLFTNRADVRLFIDYNLPH